MLRTISFFVVFWLYQLWILPSLLAVLVLRRKGRYQEAREVAARVASKWARNLMRVAGARVRVRGQVLLPPDQPALFVSNHQGAFDIPLSLMVVPRPVAFMAKKELGRLPSIGIWMRAMGCVLVDRGNRKVALQSVQQAVEALRSGVSLIVFPEGTRSNGDDLKTFKAGFARIALRAGVPIVPIVMKGTYRLKLGDQPWITPADVEVAMEAPILLEEMRDMNVHDIARRVQDVIQHRLDAEDCLAPGVFEPSGSPV